MALGAVSARPRYLVIPIEDVEFMENMELPVYSMPQLHHRIRRQAPDEQQLSANNGSPVFVEPAQRRDDGIPAFSIPAEIRQAEDAITAGRLIFRDTMRLNFFAVPSYNANKQE